MFPLILIGMFLQLIRSQPLDVLNWIINFRKCYIFVDVLSRDEIQNPCENGSELELEKPLGPGMT